MAEFDHGFKIVTDAAGPRLARLAGVPCTSWEPLTGDVQATVERLADRAFLARHRRERFVAYVEAYTYWDEAAPWDVLAKSGLLSARERLPTKSLLFVLHPRGYRPQRGKIRLSVGGALTQHVAFEEVCLWKKRPEAWWEQSPGLMTLYPLCKHGRRPEESITHAAGAIERGEGDGVRRGELLTILSIFGSLAYPNLDSVQIIGSEQMRESPFYQQIVQEGVVLKARADILAVLEERLGPEAATRVADTVNALTDVPLMDRLLRLTARCSSVEEFRRALPLVETSPVPATRRRPSTPSRSSGGRR